jgi:hypothetical protein
MVKLIRLVEAKNPAKKWRAEFSDGSHTEFGSAGMDDYTITKDKEQRDRYRSRHAKDLLTEDPTRAGFLSMFILWGDSTDIGRNLATFKRKFKL